MRGQFRLTSGEHPLLTPLACLLASIFIFLLAVLGFSLQNQKTAHKAALYAQNNCVKIEAIETRIREIIAESRDKALASPAITHAEALKITQQSQRALEKFPADPCPLPK